MKIIKKLTTAVALILTIVVGSDNQANAIETTGAPSTITNPILPGFNPDPSICRDGDNYYLVTSSFSYFPGLPIYRSKDLVNWELINHAIDKHNIDKFHFEGLGDNDGIWAPTLRKINGKFYIACTLWKGGGNFIMSAEDPAEEWSDPIWVPDAPGIDPTLFADEDGTIYYLGNRYDFKQKWSGQVGIHIQRIDLDSICHGKVGDKKTGLSFEAPIYRLKDKNHIIAYGHASNAAYAEGPHLYHIDGRYYLLMAEGGSGKNHAVTVMSSDSILGPYKPQQVNPVLTHRHLGNRYPIQNIGHADLVQTQNGDWYAVCLGNRYLPINSKSGAYACPLGRETWLTKAEIQDGQIIMAPETGLVTTEFKRPDLPWTPVKESEQQYMPMTDKKLRLKKVRSHKWDYELTVSDKDTVCGITIFRTDNSKYSLFKRQNAIELMKTEKGVESKVAEIPCNKYSATLGIKADGMDLEFTCDGQRIGEIQSYLPLCDDGRYNKFNGTGVGYILRE